MATSAIVKVTPTKAKSALVKRDKAAVVALVKR
jgi:hypothetical protein